MIPVPGAATYPAATQEQVDFMGAQVLVDGPRVVFNNPQSLKAVVVFTDGSHTPVTVDKGSAVTVSASGPVPVLEPTAPGPGSPTKTQTPANAAPRIQTVNPQVTCANTTQKPYAPQITSANPSSESVLVAWSYQLLEQQDCEPDSWGVTVTALGGAPQPSPSVQAVNGQEQLQFSGLRPATTYKVVVTAYINQQSTPSLPAVFTTNARGPDAPTSVHATSDGKGDWIVSWTPCTSRGCYVPADAWNIVGTACGSSFVGEPPSVQVLAPQTSATINARTLGLLGDSLSFSVQGVLNSGLTGPSTPDHACTQAWSPPNPAAITLAASGKAVGQTITATMQVSTGTTSAVQAFGSQQTEFVYKVGGVTVGPTTAQSVTVPGLPAGQQYTPTVTIYPAGHPGASILLTGSSFETNLPWPPVTMNVVPAINQADPALGSLTVQFIGLPTTLPAGQITAAGSLNCGSTSQPISGGVAGGRLVLSDKFNVNTIGTGCTVAGVSLTDTATPNPYGTSLTFPAFGPFDFGPQPPYAFSAAYGPIDCSQTPCAYPVTITYAGPGSAGEPPAGINWTATASGLAGTTPIAGCVASYGPSPTAQFPVTVSLTGGCSGLTNVAISVSWTYLGVVTTVPWRGSPPGPPPSTTTTTTTTTSTSTSTSTSTTTSTTTPTSTSTPSSTPAFSGNQGQGDSAQLAMASRQHPLSAVAPSVGADAEVRIALESTFLLAAAACCAGAARGISRRRHTTKPHRKEPR
jgi:hypothetical protein